MITCIIAEKPSVAQDIVRALAPVGMCSTFAASMNLANLSDVEFNLKPFDFKLLE